MCAASLQAETGVIRACFGSSTTYAEERYMPLSSASYQQKPNNDTLRSFDSEEYIVPLFFQIGLTNFFVQSYPFSIELLKYPLPGLSVPPHLPKWGYLFIYLFNTVPLHSLKYNSQRLNRRNRG